MRRKRAQEASHGHRRGGQPQYAASGRAQLADVKGQAALEHDGRHREVGDRTQAQDQTAGLGSRI